MLYYSHRKLVFYKEKGPHCLSSSVLPTLTARDLPGFQAEVFYITCYLIFLTGEGAGDQT